MYPALEIAGLNTGGIVREKKGMKCNCQLTTVNAKKLYIGKLTYQKE